MDDEAIMRQLQAALLTELQSGSRCGPFMAAIYDRSGRRIATRTNSVTESNCSHHHAEMNVIAAVEKLFKTWNLGPHDLVLYTTSEPCMMCMGGILWSGIRKVVYGVPSGRVEAITGFDEGFKPDWKTEFNRRGIEVVGPVAPEAGEEVHRYYMQKKRPVYNAGRQSEPTTAGIRR